MTMDILDTYGFGDSDDPFRSPSPEPAKEQPNKKRKEPGGLGIDEEVAVTKKTRKPNVKIDEEKLLSEAGIPTLRKRAAGLKFKGKGHEFSDAARLLSFYQLWLDDLAPKARFLDALAMVEKTGHKKVITRRRLDWIDEARRGLRGDAGAEVNDPFDATDLPGAAPSPKAGANSDESRNAASKESGAERAATPQRDDVPDLEELYGSTPGARRWDNVSKVPAPAKDSAAAEDDMDDLDALIAEAEQQDSMGGADGPQASAAKPSEAQDFADEEAAMAELDGLW